MEYETDSQCYTLRGGINPVKWGITEQTVNDSFYKVLTLSLIHI